MGSVRSASFSGAVAARTGGGYVAAWRDADGVRFRVLDETAQPRSGVRELPTEPALLLGALDVAATADSGFVVVWASGTKLLSVRCEESGDCSRPALVGVANHGIFEATVERRGNGHLVAFVRPQPSLGSFEFGAVVVQRLDGSGRASGAPQVLTPAGEADYEPDLRFAAGLGFVVAWARWGGEGRFGDIFVQAFEESGRPRGVAHEVNAEFPPADQSAPKVFLRPNGRGAVAFLDHDDQLTAQDLDPEGSPEGPARVLAISEVPGMRFGPPEIFRGSDGRPLVRSAWSGFAVPLFGDPVRRPLPGHAGLIARSANPGDTSAVVLWFDYRQGHPRAAVRAQRIEVP